MIRRSLSQRRAAETFDLRFRNQLFTVTVGFYTDGTPGEVFIDGGKTGQDIQSIARDAAVVLSLALQHGTPVAQSEKHLVAHRRVDACDQRTTMLGKCDRDGPVSASGNIGAGAIDRIDDPRKRDGTVGQGGV